MGVDGFCSDAEMEQEIAFGVSYILTVGVSYVAGIVVVA